MCRGKNRCSELGIDPTKWDIYCPLRPPIWIDREISKFVQAVDQLIEGNRDNCVTILDTIRDNDFTEWYIEHGQMSGKHRKKQLDITDPEQIAMNLRDPQRSPKKFQDKVFIRDNYHCRYCGTKLISLKLMKKVISLLDTEKFKKGPTNRATHGIILATTPVADHVIPWNIGGRTNLDNLIASCYACNYGKDGYTCEQMGITDPYIRPPIRDEWDGLVSREAYVK